MRILAIETTAFTGSLALAEGGQLVREARLPPDSRSAQSLAPAIESLLSDQGWPVKSLRLIAVVQGPGSFTGLRVGVTTAKTLAYAIGAEMLGLDTLEVLAAQARLARGVIHPVVDAQRGQLFTARFAWPEAAAFPSRQTATGISDLQPWLLALQPDDIVIGPVAGKLAPQVRGILPLESIVNCEPQASMAAQLAWRDYQAGRRDDVWKLLPQYHRLSAAEEKQSAQQSAAPS